jgi:hypothetical protein
VALGQPRLTKPILGGDDIDSVPYGNQLPII